MCLQWEPVQYFNNKIICDLVEEKFKGIISILVRIHDELHLCSVTGLETMFFIKGEPVYSIFYIFLQWIFTKTLKKSVLVSLVHFACFTSCLSEYREGILP